MLNHIELQGRFVKDPELRTTTNQNAVVRFTLAVDRNYGEDKQTDFIDCVAWKHTAEFINNYFSKGKMAVIEGQLHIQQWTDKDNNSRRSAEVNVTNIYFGESKNSSNGKQKSGPSEISPENEALLEDLKEINIDDLPF